MLRSLVRSLLVAILAEAVIVWNTGSVLRERGAMVLDLESRRFWEDLSLAVGYYKTGDLPVSYDAVERWKDATGGSYYRERGGALTRGAVRAGLSPWHFWRTVPPRHHDRLAFELFPRFDDSGRPLLLGYGFRLLGGVAPFLLYWLGALLAFPLLWALAFEIDRSGRPLAAALATLSLGFSAFLGDALSMSYSAAGFHVLGVLLLSAFAASTCLRAPRPGALFLKALLAGIVFAVLVACRGGALLLGPGFVIAALVGAAKAGAWRPALGLWGVACFLLFLPTVVLKQGIERLTERTFASRSRGAAPPQHHAVWFGIWTGLGLSGTLIALTLAYAIRFLAVSLGSVEAGLERISPNLDAAARALGEVTEDILIGSNEPITYDPSAWMARLQSPAVAEYLGPTGVRDASRLLSRIRPRTPHSPAARVGAGDAGCRRQPWSTRFR